MRRAAVVLLIGALPAGAQDAIDCSAPATQADMNACAAQEFEAADALMATAYDTALATMRGIDAALPEAERGGEAALEEAQRAWITARDQTCIAEGYIFHGGSAEPMVVSGCMAIVTRQRTEHLKRFTGF